MGMVGGGGTEGSGGRRGTVAPLPGGGGVGLGRVSSLPGGVGWGLGWVMVLGGHNRLLFVLGLEPGIPGFWTPARGGRVLSDGVQRTDRLLLSC